MANFSIQRGMISWPTNVEPCVIGFTFRETPAFQNRVDGVGTEPLIEADIAGYENARLASNISFQSK